MNTVSHLYLHIPFCVSRCSYCDFYSNTDASAGISEYVDRLLVEAAACGDNLAPLDTVYLGGGTPTLIGERLLGRLLDGLAKRLAPAAEVTVEANPETIDEKMAACLRDAGVTRVSLGAQSFNEGMRENLGRSGRVEAIGSAVADLRKAGLENIGLDLIFGIPGQDTHMLASDLENVVALAPEHISYYELTFTADGDFHRRWERELEEAGGNSPSFYELVVETLEAAGYGWYETSNFAQPGYECRHNISYWRGKDFIGLGAGAWSTTGHLRWRNTEDLERYVEDDVDWNEIRKIEHLSQSEKQWETVMLGLRLSSGVSLEQVRPIVDQALLRDLEAGGFLSTGSGKLALTVRGRFVANEIYSRILP